MRKKTSLAVVLTTLGMVAITSLLASFPFWLASPTRSNPNDPMSPHYVKPGTPTVTPTYTETVELGSPTETETPSATPSSTSTLTPAATPIYWYTGATPYNLAGLVPGVDSDLATNAGYSEMGSGGPIGGTATYMQITFTVNSGGWGNALLGAGSWGPVDVTSANTLNLWIRQPSGPTGTIDACDANLDFRPYVQLRVNDAGGYPNDRGPSVTCTAYLVGTSVIGEDTWDNVQIPLTALVGVNTNGGSISMANLTAVATVAIGVWWGDYDGNGTFPAETSLDVDDVVFTSPGTAPTNQGLQALGTEWQDFEGPPGTTEWGINGDGTSPTWIYEDDAIPASWCPTGTTLTSVVFPSCGATPEAGTAGSNPPENGGWSGTSDCASIDSFGDTLSCSHAGYFSGVQNATVQSGLCSDPAGGATAWPLVRMSSDFWDNGPTAEFNPAATTYVPGGGSQDTCGSVEAYVDVSNNNTITSLPAGGATGFRFWAMTHAVTGQVYSVQIMRLSTCDWHNWQVTICDSALTNNKWQEFILPFPPDGTPAATVSGAIYDNEGNASMCGSQYALTWGQATWEGGANWGRTDFYKLVVRAENPGAFDFAIGNIGFY